MIAKRTFVIAASASWGSLPRTGAQALAREIAGQNGVLYVNPPTDMASLLAARSTFDLEHKSRVLRGSEPAIRRITRNLWVLEPPVLISSGSKVYSTVVFDLLNRRNSHRYAEVIRWAMQTIGMDDPYLILDNDVTRCFYLREFLHPALTVYYRAGYRAEPGDIGIHTARLEPELVRKADLVITASEPLAEQARPYNLNTFNIGRGVDDECLVYDTKPAPEAAALPRPIIGCCGDLSIRSFSPDTICRIAAAFPECSIALVGPEDAAFRRHPVHSYPNVRFLGDRSDRELPGYIRCFDVCIQPQQFNPLTEADFPENVVRYLAHGKRVIAAATGPMGVFLRYVSLARDQDEFLDLTARALAEQDTPQQQQRRREFARNFSWANCAERLCTAIDFIEDELFEQMEYEFDEDMLYS